VLTTSQNKTPQDWSRDGKYVLYATGVSGAWDDIWALPMDPKGEPFPVVNSKFSERFGQFSPDGKWLAYSSDESGGYEVYVQEFPKGRRQQLSTNGGGQVRWRADGKELFFIAPDRRLMALEMRPASNGKGFERSTPVGLFKVEGVLDGLSEPRQQYVVSSDGQRFLWNVVTKDGKTAPMTILLNWKSAQ
jgi:Tol biopolymer transport system component